jgi:hypothetical protein
MTEPIWAPVAGSNYPKHFEREGQWELFFEKVLAGDRWVFCLKSVEEPTRGRTHNHDLCEGETEEAQKWADKYIDGDGKGFRQYKRGS